MLTDRLLPILGLMLLAPALVLTGCDDDHWEEEPRDPDGETVRSLPPGGSDLGTFFQFEHNFDQQTIDSEADRDGFIFTLNETATVIIAVTSLDSLDPYVDLYDDSFHFINGDNDSGPATDGLLVGTLSAGDYVLVIGGEGESEGTYTVDILTASTDGEDFGVGEPGDFFASSGSILGSTDEQSFVLTVFEDVTIDLAVFRTSGDFDGNLQIVDQFGQEVGFIDPSGDADPSLSNVALTPGTYLIVIGASSGSGDYDVELDIDP